MTKRAHPMTELVSIARPGKIMNPVQNAIFCAKTKLCILVVLIILITIILAISLSVKEENDEENLKFASKKLDFPVRYVTTRPNTADAYKEILYLSTEGTQIGRAKRCILCEATWTFYLLNKDDEIAVIVKKTPLIWGDIYDIEEQWKINATSYKVEYYWSGIGIIPELYVIKNSHGDGVSHTDQFRLGFDKIITLKDSKRNSTLGRIERPAFEFFPTWKIFVNETDVVPTYLFGVLATITTLKEVDNDED